MRLLRPFLLAGVPLIAVLGAGLWWLWGGRYVSTEHAIIKAGDPLLKIDPESFAIALQKAEAEFDQARAQVAGMRAQYAEAQAELKEADSKTNFYDAQYARQNQLKQRGVGFAFRFEE